MASDDAAVVAVWRGPDGLSGLTVELAGLSQDPANARLHSRKNLDAIKGSLAKYGQQKPIVVGPDGVVVAGNGTVIAARELGWTHLAAVTTDLESVDRTGFALTDNRAGELAEWDYKIAAAHLESLADAGVNLAELGWDEGEVANLLSAEWSPPSPDDDLEGYANAADAGGGHKVGFTGDQWETVARAVEVVRGHADDAAGQLGEGRLIELMAADWLAGQ